MCPLWFGSTDRLRLDKPNMPKQHSKDLSRPPLTHKHALPLGVAKRADARDWRNSRPETAQAFTRQRNTWTVRFRRPTLPRPWCTKRPKIVCYMISPAHLRRRIPWSPLYMASPTRCCRQVQHCRRQFLQHQALPIYIFRICGLVASGCIKHSSHTTTNKRHTTTHNIHQQNTTNNTLGSHSNVISRGYLRGLRPSHCQWSCSIAFEQGCEIQ